MGVIRGVNRPSDFRWLFGMAPVARVTRAILRAKLHDHHPNGVIPLPLLDWSEDEKRAKQAWHGFLFGRRIDLDLVPDLLPLYIQTFRYVR